MNPAISHHDAKRNMNPIRQADGPGRLFKIVRWTVLKDVLSAGCNDGRK
jgi:hypothetical protein